MYWHIPHYHSSGVRPSGAVRRGDYKLNEYFEDRRVELFDLSKDLSEQQDPSQQKPDVTAELKAALGQWRDKVGATMPSLNNAK